MPQIYLKTLTQLNRSAIVERLRAHRSRFEKTVVATIFWSASMKLSQLLTVEITNKTFISLHKQGERHSCTFLGDGENLSISFDVTCLHQLLEFIGKLQEIHQILMEERQKQITQELKIINHCIPVLPIYNGNGRNHPEVEIEF